MNLTLINKVFGENGIFGELLIEDGTQLAVTLQHAYLDDDHYLPKIPEGIYTCKRGAHLLEGMNHTFETFEVLKVPGHKGCLFHVGNENKDSSGCILLGEYRTASAVMNSRLAFERFMALQRDVNEFKLTVIDGEGLG